jgi:hypothetical protein
MSTSLSLAPSEVSVLYMYYFCSQRGGVLLNLVNDAASMALLDIRYLRQHTVCHTIPSCSAPTCAFLQLRSPRVWHGLCSGPKEKQF